MAEAEKAPKSIKKVDVWEPVEGEPGVTYNKNTGEYNIDMDRQVHWAAEPADYGPGWVSIGGKWTRMVGGKQSKALGEGLKGTKFDQYGSKVVEGQEPFMAALKGLVTPEGEQAQRAAQQAELLKGAGGALQKIRYGAAGRGLVGRGAGYQTQPVEASIATGMATIEANLAQQRTDKVIKAATLADTFVQKQIDAMGLDQQAAENFYEAFDLALQNMLAADELHNDSDYVDLAQAQQLAMEFYRDTDNLQAALLYFQQLATGIMAD